MKYTIQASVSPESLSIAALMHVEYHNGDSRELSQIAFRLPSRDKAIVVPDSILYRGAPLRDSLIAVNENFMALTLPEPLRPDEVGPILMSFTTTLCPDKPRKKRGCNVVSITDWMPLVCVFRTGHWFVECFPGDCGEYADFRVALEIDSAFTIAFPGELMNEREHFGFLPKRADDTILVNLTAEHSRDLTGQPYRPTFPNGRKMYYVKADNITTFPFVISRRFLIDRVYRRGLTIDVYYRACNSAVWSGRVGRKAVKLIEQYEGWLGRLPYNHLTIVAGEATDIGPAGPLIILPACVRDTNLLETILAVQLARVWFPPVLPETHNTEQYIDDGMAYFAAIRTLHDRYGSDGYNMIREHRQYLMRTYPHSDEYLALASTGLFQVPVQLNALRCLVGDLLFLRSLQAYIDRFRKQYVTVDDVLTSLPRQALEQLGFAAGEIGVENVRLDLAVSEMVVIKQNNRYGLHYTVENRGNLALPAEVAIVVNTGDTVYRTLALTDLPLPGAAQGYTDTVDRRPMAIAIDPRHRLPDSNRRNNYAFTPPRRFIYRLPRNMFPPYDFLN
ncbi:MAG: hypothetical protein AB1744_03675 [Candidatus Zixiibacteriota bacterium]